MYLLEVAAQNVRGFSPTVRAALKPGYNVLKPPTEAAAELGLLASALCFADGRGGEATFLAPGAAAGKAGLSIFGKDQVTYRLLRELGGTGSLHRLNANNQKYELVSQDAAEIAQFLRAQVGLPTRNVHEAIFCVLGSQLPSRKPKPAAAPAPAPRRPSRDDIPVTGSGERRISRDDIPIAPVEDLAAAELRVHALQAELKTAKETAEIQFEFDGRVSEIYDIESKQKMLAELKEQAAEAEAGWKKAPSAASLQLPADLARRCEQYPDAVAKRDAELAKLKDAREEDLDPLWGPQQKKVQPLFKDERFWYGVGAGVAALVAGALLNGWLKYVALLDIPAFGFAGILAYRWVEELQAAYWDKRRGGRKAAREQKIREEFEAHVGAVEKAFDLLQVEKAEEVLEKLGEKDRLLAQFNALRAKIEAFENDPAFQAMAARLPEAKAEQARLNDELVARGGYMREPREVEKDLERLQKSIALAKSSGAAAPAPAAVAAASADKLEDPTPALLKLAADQLGTDLPGTAKLVRDRVLQYFSALTDKRYGAIELDAEGRATAIAAGQRIRLGELPPRDADLLFLSVKLTVVEKVAQRLKAPLFVEDGIASVDEAKLPLLGRMLKHLGTITQVLHVTSHGAFPASADSTATL